MALSKRDIASTTFAVTFTLFMVEAVMHYNLGRKEADPEGKKGFLPPTKAIIKLGLIVGVFSLINGIAIKELTEN